MKLLLKAGLALALCRQTLAQSNSSSSAARTTSSSPAASGGVLTATSLLPVPSRASASPLPAASASALAASIPGYTYNLTSEPLLTRASICNQTVAFCASAKCTTSTANVTTNFCNSATMGWNCECDGGATSRLQDIAVPVNFYDCQLRAGACQQACQNPLATPPVSNVQTCQTACSVLIGSTCGTGSMYIPSYKVSSMSDKPSYYPDTSKGGVVGGVTTKAGGAARGTGVGSAVLAVAAAALALL